MAQPGSPVRTAWIAGYEGRYRVTDDGRVLSYVNTRGNPRRRPWTLLPTVTARGYLRVTLRLPGRRACYRTVHQLVARAFVPNPRRLRGLNHLDFNRRNNQWSNLEWATPKENTAHSLKAGRLKPLVTRRGEQHHAHKLTERDARKAKAMIADGMSNWRIAKVFGVWEGTIRNIRKGISWRWL